MITTLILTVVLGGQDVAKFGYVYPDQAQCNSATHRAGYATTGRYTVELECRPEPTPSPAVYQAPTDWQALVMSMVLDTKVVVMDPTEVSTLPDSASCDAYIAQATKRFKMLGGRDFVSFCLPKAP